MEFKIQLSDNEAEKLKELAEKLKADPNEVIAASLSAMSAYAGELAAWALDLRVRRENRVEALFDEVYYYAVEAWRGLVARILEALKARGRFELEALEFDPVEPSVLVEFAALEGSDLLTDRLRVDWSLDGVLVEAYYYLEEGVEPPLPKSGEGFDWSYLPDEHAVIVTVTGRRLRDIPPVHVLDELSGLKG